MGGVRDSPMRMRSKNAESATRGNTWFKSFWRMGNKLLSLSLLLCKDRLVEFPLIRYTFYVRVSGKSMPKD